MAPKQSRSFLISRALIAIALMIGFYLLAISIAGGLAWVPYAMIKYGHRVYIKIAIVCVVGALAIIWAIIPRFDKFIPPGPKLEPHEHPKFFELLRAIAGRTGQEMPAEVYLVPDVNAWVMQRGGIMGFGSRRVMGVGLPLLQVFTIPEFSAVLAHEFGHYHGGDTKLGPWIYKTRGMIGRTVMGLGDSILNYPFIWYGNMFLRITHAVSRQQEYLADELAARAVSPQALISGLKKVHGAAMGFHGYVQGEFAPVFTSKLRTPFVEGFRQYLGSPKVTEGINKSIEKELAEGKSKPYDTHPALKDRIAALQSLPSSSTQENDTLAITLLANPERYEADLLKSLTGVEHLNDYQTIGWHEVGAQVYVPIWKKNLAEFAWLLQGKTVEDIYLSCVDFENFGKNFASTNDPMEKKEEKLFMTTNVLGTAFALALHENGWAVESELGKAIRLTNNGLAIEPFVLLAEIAEGKVTREQWDQTTAGLKTLSLAQAKTA